MKFASKLIATVFGIGYFPFAPGTLTSLVFVFLYKFVLYKMDWSYYLALLLLLFFIGALASAAHASQLKKEDPQCIVVDEGMGQLVALFHLSPDWYLLGIGFALFRALDILKPFVIKKAEKIPGGWGIMMDDVIAGLIASIILNLYLILK
ncbi:phosphatidylglycerophosphatase A [Acidobacteriota bacterium]